MIKKPSIETYLFSGLSFAAMAAIALHMPEPSSGIQILALAIGVALIGLPHGALDPLLARRAGLLTDWRSAVLFHAAYLAAAALVLGLWVFAPVLALLFFLIYSAHHFAGDWLDKSFAARLALGASVLSLPAMFHVKPVADIYVLLSGDTAGAIATAQLWLAPIWLLILGAAIAVFWWQRRFSHALELTVLAFGAMLLPPLIFFIIYFCTLHSPRHFLAIWRESSDRRRAAGIAAVYTMATLIIAIVAFFVFERPDDLIGSVQHIVFIGLAALTVPHMILTSILESRHGD